MSTFAPDKLSSSQLKDFTTEFTYGTRRRQKGWTPLEITEAEGCYFTDVNGKKYLDFSAQLMCVTLGHKNRAIIQTIKDQAEKLAYIAPGYATEVRAELSKMLTEVLPQASPNIVSPPQAPKPTKPP